MYLHCTPDIMDFRWNSAKLYGINTVLKNVQTTCAIEDSLGNIGDTSPLDVDKMWKHSPASCDSTVTRENVDGTGTVGKNHEKIHAVLFLIMKYRQPKLLNFEKT